MGFQINQITVSGNLTREVDVRALPGGTTVASFSIAHNERRKNKQTDVWDDVAHFFDVTLFGAQGDWLGKNVTKGDPITVSGVLEQQRWVDKTTNENRSKVSILARDIVLGQRGGGQQAQQQAQPQGYGQAAAQPQGYGAPAGGSPGAYAPAGGYAAPVPAQQTQTPPASWNGHQPPPAAQPAPAPTQAPPAGYPGQPQPTGAPAAGWTSGGHAAPQGVGPGDGLSF